MVYFCISSEIISEANGGLVGQGRIEDDLGLVINPSPLEPDKEVLNEDVLEDMKVKVLRYIRCLVAVTIAATQLQERTLMEVYLLLSLVMSGIIFPLTQSWM